MIYEFVIPQKDGTNKIVERSSGCWGACGRLDSYSPKKGMRKVIEDFVAEYSGYTSVTSSSDSNGWFGSYELSHVRLSPKDPVYGQMFHISMYETMEYFVERSPFSMLFNQKWADAYKQNYLDVDCSTAPSQITMVALIWLRDVVCSYGFNFNSTFTTLLSTGLFPEGLCFITTMMAPRLNNGSAYEDDPDYEAWGSQSYEFWTHAGEYTVETWDEHYHVLMHSCTELGGYPIILCDFWEHPKQSIKSADMYKAHRDNSKKINIEGIFGTIPFTGVHDPVQYTRTLWNLA